MIKRSRDIYIVPEELNEAFKAYYSSIVKSAYIATTTPYTEDNDIIYVVDGAPLWFEDETETSKDEFIETVRTYVQQEGRLGRFLLLNKKEQPGS